MNLPLKLLKDKSITDEQPIFKISPVKVPSGAKHIGNYILGKTIGNGSFGKVHLGLQIQSGQKVAVKIIQKQKLNHKDLERVHRQIQILKLMIHPSLIQLYQIIQTEKSLLLITEFMQNGELFNYILQNKKLNEMEGCRIFQQIIDGVDYMHHMGVVHRDLKPQNIMIDFDGRIKIIDFGLSNTYQPGQKLKTQCGSPCYAAPEMIEGKQKYNPLQTDIWSCGIVLFAMLAGYLPFCDADTAKLYKKIMSGTFTFPSWISEDAKDLISRILTVNPHKRIKLNQIKQHSWFQNIPYQCKTGIDQKCFKIPTQSYILNHVQSMGINSLHLGDALQKNLKNKETSIYYLLAKKMVRDGYPVKSYIGSPYFDIKLSKSLSEDDNNSTAIVEVSTQQISIIQQPFSAKPNCLPSYNLKSVSFRPILLEFLSPLEIKQHYMISQKQIFYHFNPDNWKKKEKLTAKTIRQRAETLFHINKNQSRNLTKLPRLQQYGGKKKTLQMLSSINTLPQSIKNKQRRMTATPKTRSYLNC